MPEEKNAEKFVSKRKTKKRKEKHRTRTRRDDGKWATNKMKIYCLENIYIDILKINDNKCLTVTYPVCCAVDWFSSAG